MRKSLPGSSQDDGAVSFGVTTNYGVGNNPRSAAAGDFNNDGKPDIATAYCSNNNNVSVKLHR